MLAAAKAAFLSGLVAFLAALVASKLNFRLPERPPETLDPDPPSEIPRVGGIFLFLGVLVGLAALPDTWIGDVRWVALAGLVPVFLIGVVDDVRPVNCYLKLGFQLLGGTVVAALGLVPDRVALPGGGEVSLGLLAVPLTVFWLASTANAYNLIDGVDGLATGLGVIASATLALAGWVAGNSAAVALGAVVAAALLGVLFFTANPARFYLGDSGSLSVGFLVGLQALLIVSEDGAVRVVPIVLALAIPLGDMLFAILRRTARGQHPFHRDHEHIHHRLQRLGLSPRHVSWTLWATGGIVAALGLWILIAIP